MKNMGVIMKIKINQLATMFYQMNGYTSPKGFDFQRATHPHEKGCWNQAVVAWSFLKEDAAFAKHQNE